MKKLTRRITHLALITFVAGSYLVVLAPGVWAKGSAKAGKSLYDGKCAMCHAQNGSGDSSMGKGMKVPDLRSPAVQKQTDAQLADVIAKGKKMMPQYGSQISKEQINDLVAYIRELGSKKK
ncbi:MAG TPA: cytochrome c [Terriglobia bacterium]|nr:cytochrome c [Terriglobia bacterium]